MESFSDESDEFKWLEHENMEAINWQQGQAERAGECLRSWPVSEPLRDRLKRFSAARRDIVPRYAGGKWFRIDQSELVVSSEPFGKGKSFSTFWGDSVVILWISPCPAGETVAIGICEDASERNKILLLNVNAGELLNNPPPQLLMDGWTLPVWAIDGSGFYFTALLGEPSSFEKGIFFHDIKSGTQTRQEVPMPEDQENDYAAVVVSSDGRYLHVNLGLLEPSPIAICDTWEKEPCWKLFRIQHEGMVVGIIIDRHFVALTTVEAPRGRVVSIPLEGDPNDTGRWRELVPESKRVIRSMSSVGEYLYLSEFADMQSYVTVVDLEGRKISEVPLPERLCVLDGTYPYMDLSPKGHPDEYLFTACSPSQSSTVYRHRPGDDKPEVLLPPEVELGNVIIETNYAVSGDGVRIPFTIIQKKDLCGLKQPRPTLIHVYGGYNLILYPEYSRTMAAFVEAGGVYIYAHLRGGGEMGRNWWYGGSFKNKKKCFDDLYAIAEKLIDEKYTTTDLLALTGTSNGGMVCGVAITQRPDLWAVVVPQAARFDLLLSLKEPYGRFSIKSDRVDPDDPEASSRLASYSPYHAIKEGASYPAVFITGGATDPRCPALHARKFAARLQKSSVSGKPVLIHIWEKAGHGIATTADIKLDQDAEWLAFVMMRLGMA